MVFNNKTKVKRGYTKLKMKEKRNLRDIKTK